MRVVLDTNVLARPSFSQKGAAAALLEALKAPEHAVVASAFILDELNRVLRYPRLQKLHGFDDAGIGNYVGSIRQAATMVQLPDDPPPAVATNDPDDDPIVETAVAGKVNVLCTRDHHLRSQPVVDYCAAHGIRVMTDVELLQVLRALRGAATRVEGDDLILLAHRGDSRVAPENTLPAFESALKLGVDLVELDYHQSADGVPVVFHDKELDRCSDACARWGGQKILLASRNWSDLCQLDAGRWYGEQFAGTRLATLEQALSLICPQAGCMIERKSGDPETLVALIERLGFVDRCVVMAFDWNFLARCRQLSPSIILGALGTERLTTEHLDAVTPFAPRVIGWDNRHITAEAIELAHRLSLKVWVWTVDDAARAEELIAWGVNGLITNVPGTIKPVIAASRRQAGSGP